MRNRGVYLVVRDLHLGVEDEGVREGCDRLVQVLMRDEEGEAGGGEGGSGMNGRGVGELGRGAGEAPGRMVTQIDGGEGDEDEEVVEIF